MRKTELKWKRVTAVFLIMIGILASFKDFYSAKANVIVMEQQFLEMANGEVGKTWENSLCLAWVKDFWVQKFGNIDSTACCAYHYSIENGRIVSTSRDNIPIGANVYFHGGSKVWCGGDNCGHVGIYVGNGKIINARKLDEDPQTIVGIDKISDWEKWGAANGYYKFAGWGWHDGIVVSDNGAEWLYNESSKYNVVKKTSIKSMPCSEKTDPNSKTLETLSPGDYVIISEVFKNIKTKNVWYRVVSSFNNNTKKQKVYQNTWAYVYSGDFSYDSDYSVVKWDGNSLNGATLPRGKSYSIGGNIRCSNEIVKIEAQPYVGKSCWGNPIIDYPSSKTYQYSVLNSKIDT